MTRRLAVLCLVALCLLVVLWTLRRHDVAGPGWRPPELSIGRDQHDLGRSTTGGGRAWGIVTCTVDRAFGADPGRLVARADDGASAVSVASGRDLSLELVPGEWTVTWHSALGVKPAETRRLGLVEIAADDMESCLIEPAGWRLSGEVRSVDGDRVAAAEVEGCEARVTADESGRFEMRVRRGDCNVRAWSRDGMLRRPGKSVYFSPFDMPGPLALTVEDDDIGGVGLGLSSRADGLEVGLIVSGGPGSAAGLQVGDVVVAVDGVSVRGWGVAKGVAAITGVPGSTVKLTVRQGDDPPEVFDLVRARLQPQTDTGEAGVP